MDENNPAKQSHEPASLATLRERAEQLRHEQPVTPVTDLDAKEAARLIHELRTHQVELRMQNDELRRAQQELAEAHDRYVDLYDVAPVGYVTLDAQGNIAEANKTVADLLGEERASLVGKKLSDYVGEAHQDAYFINLRRLLAGQGDRQCELRLRRADGSLLWARTEWLYLPARNDMSPRVRATISDLTEVEALRHLVQADRLANMGLLAAGIAHEINNPLTFVLLNLETLADSLPSEVRHLSTIHQALDGPAREKVGAVEHALNDLCELAQSAADGARRIREIAKRLRVFSGLEREPTMAVEIASVLDSAVHMARHEIKFRARLVTQYDDVPEIVANPGELCQVFLNLLLNAAHAIPEGNVEDHEVRITSRQEGDHILVSVCDTGCGIDPKLLDQIFDPFFTTKDVGVGSGLGLSICKKIITSHGGEIDVKSTLGEGSVFEVRLPIEARHPRELKGHATASSSATTAPPVRGRVLVIDDEPGITLALARILRAHDVKVVHSGLEARELLERGEDFDVILCDLMMPHFSGMDLHAWLETERPGLVERVVYMTGAAFTPRAQLLLRNVPNLCIEKPFSYEKVRKIVRQVIAAGRH